LASTCDNVK
jgi:hypothetical protein